MNTLPFSASRLHFAMAVLLASMLFGHTASAGITPAAQPQNHGVPAADIHDIRGPKPIASPWLIPMLAVGTLCAFGGIYAVWALNRRRFREASKRPLDLALDRLEKARLLMLPAQGREFSIEVAGAVRDYIENRFELKAAHMTTDEFLHQVLEPASSVLSEHRSSLNDFLETCDLAKFGGWNLAMTDMQTMLDAAHRFVVASAGTTQAHPAQSTAPVTADQPTKTASRETYVSLPST